MSLTNRFYLLVNIQLFGLNWVIWGQIWPFRANFWPFHSVWIQKKHQYSVQSHFDNAFPINWLFWAQKSQLCYTKKLHKIENFYEKPVKPVSWYLLACYIMPVSCRTPLYYQKITEISTVASVTLQIIWSINSTNTIIKLSFYQGIKYQVVE